MRISANSRARWATVMDIVLKMMKAPTNRAMPPKATRPPCRIFRKSLRPPMSKRSCSSAVLTSALRGSAGAIAFVSSPGSVPDLPSTRIESTWPCFLNRRCAVPSVKIAAVALPIDLTSPNRAIPVMRYWRTGPRALTPIVSPSRYPLSSAVPASIAMSRGPRGKPPASNLNGLRPAARGWKPS
jgi:hypothetical protein